MWMEVNRTSKKKEKLMEDMETLKKEHSEFKSEINSKFTELSKKIDSRVDKAVVSLKKQSKTIND
jgi:Skp family chaperone for outer membrane proteins